MNDIRDQNYFALDLELNNLSDGSVPRIIEVGVAIGSPRNPDSIVSVNWYLNPDGPISPFISKLTGITDEVISERSLPHKTVAKDLGALIDVYKCFPNPITWGQGDADELKAEFRERGIDFPHFGRRIFDVKTIFVFDQIVKGNSPSGGLKKAMNMYGIKFQGEPHRASVDAVNTLRLFFHLVLKSRELLEGLEKIRKFH